MADFLNHHVRHHIGCGPHALADLRLAAEAASQADLDIARLISLNPGRSSHLRFADHRSGLHRGVHFVASAIKEARVYEDNSVADGVNAGGKVRAGAAFFVHDADLDGVAGKAKHIFDSVEKVVGEGGFFWAVHLWLNDIDAASAAVAVRAECLQIMKRAERRE